MPIRPESRIHREGWVMIWLDPVSYLSNVKRAVVLYNTSRYIPHRRKSDRR